MTRVLVVDNYDSFTYNLVQYLGEMGAEIEVVRNDRATVDDLLAREPERVVVSPGPCTPDDAGISLEVVRRFPEAGIPTLGVCLGHQAMAQAFGGRVTRGEPVHGKTTTVEHDGRTIYEGLANPLTAGRYHSLIVDPDLPECFERTAQGGGVVMGIRHRGLPAEGVQFHPESVLTEGGKDLLANFLSAGHATAAMPGGGPVDIVRAFVAACNGDREEEVLAVCHPDFEMTEAEALPGAVDVRGHEALLRYVRGFKRNWSAYRWEPQGFEVSGDRVWMPGRLHLTGSSSGIEVDRLWHYVFTVRDGLIARQDGFDDEADARRAAGLDA